MSASWERRIERLEKKMLPKPRPDMTNWTTLEKVQWEAEQVGLQAMVRASQDSDGPGLPEEWDARDARDESLMADRAAKAAAEALARDPTSLRLERRVRETREEADRKAQAARDAQRIAEDAKRRPRPPEPPVDSPPVEAQPAPGAATPAPESETNAKPEAKPKRKRKPREPGMPPRKKQWWEERAKWTLRAPVDEDARRGRPMYETIHEYDPLEAEEDYDLFGE